MKIEEIETKLDLPIFHDYLLDTRGDNNLINGIQCLIQLDKFPYKTTKTWEFYWDIYDPINIHNVPYKLDTFLYIELNKIRHASGTIVCQKFENIILLFSKLYKILN